MHASGEGAGGTEGRGCHHRSAPAAAARPGDREASAGRARGGRVRGLLRGRHRERRERHIMDAVRALIPFCLVLEIKRNKI